MASQSQQSLRVDKLSRSTPKKKGLDSIYASMSEAIRQTLGEFDLLGDDQFSQEAAKFQKERKSKATTPSLMMQSLL